MSTALVFGASGGTDYEKDTYRVDNIIRAVTFND